MPTSTWWAPTRTSAIFWRGPTLMVSSTCSMGGPLCWICRPFMRLSVHNSAASKPSTSSMLALMRSQSMLVAAVPMAL